MSTANKLTYLNGTKQAIKQAINEDFEVIDNNTTFREYADEISSNNAKYKDLIPKETKNATNTLDISNSAGLDKALVTQYGNTYQEGEPTPDTPQEIQVVTGDNTINICGKNLLSTSFKLGTINSYGMPGGATNRARTGYEEVQPNKTYIFSSSNLNIYFVPYFYDESYTFISYDNGWKAQTTTITTPSNTKYLRLLVKNNLTDTITLGEITQPQLEQRSTATTYEPYQSQSYHVSLGNIELCKIGNYKDYIFKNTQDSPHYDNTLTEDAWYLNKQIGKVVLDGSENWSARAFPDNSYLSIKYTLQVGANGGYCDKFISNNSYDIVEEHIILNKQWNEICFAILKSRLSTPDTTGFKSWLSTHNTTAYYVLATPITTEITENNYPTLYNQLNNIKLFEGVNHITMTNESGLDVEFDITYYKDWKLD